MPITSGVVPQTRIDRCHYSECQSQGGVSRNPEHSLEAVICVSRARTGCDCCQIACEVQVVVQATLPFIKPHHVGVLSSLHVLYQFTPDFKIAIL